MRTPEIKTVWTIYPLGQVLKTTSGGTPSRGNPLFYQGVIPWVKSGELNQNIIFDTEEHISEEAIKNSSAKIFPPGTLLIALYGATIGKLAFLGKHAATNQAVCGIFENDLFEHKFLFNYLFHKRQKLIEQGTGGAQPNISQTILKKLPVPIPPLPEQRAIVAKIEQLFSELDNGIANLRTVQEQLKVYRQAVLKKAFEGQYTSRVFNEVCEKIQDGSHFSPKEQSQVREIGMFPYITSKNIRNNFMDLSNVTYVNQEFHDTIYRRCDPIKGDLLLTKDGVNTGNVTLNIFNEPISLLSSVCLLRPKRDVLSPEFVKYYIQSPDGFRELTGKMTGTAIRRIILKRIKQAEIPVPALIEQTQIVQEIETRLSVCDNILANIEDGLEKSEALRQSILKQAFEGKLLSEVELEACRKEPDWEPAEKLLERIQVTSKHKKVAL